MNDNIIIFNKWNYIEPSEQPGYTIYYGNWGTYYSNLTKEQLLFYYRTFLKNSAYKDFGDLYVWFNGNLIRTVNWLNYKTFTVTK